MRLFLITAVIFFVFISPVWAEETGETQPSCNGEDAACQSGEETCTGEEATCEDSMPEEGMLVYTEISVTDLDMAAEFYGTLFGWTFIDFNERNRQFITPGDLFGGLTLEGEPGMGGTVVYICVDDIDTKLPEIVDAGGTLFVEKMEIPGQGWLALFADPFGNLLGLFQCKQ